MAAAVSVYEQRLSDFRAALEAEGLAGAVVSRPQHLFFFTGDLSVCSPSFLLVDSSHLLAVSPYPVKAVETVIYSDEDLYHGWQVNPPAAHALEKALAQLGWVRHRIGLELNHLPAVFLRSLSRSLGDPFDLEELLWSVRRIKDSGEIAQIQANISANDAAFQAIQASIRPGISELDLWAVIGQVLTDRAGEPVQLEADIGAGVRGSQASARPGRSQLEHGEALFVDIYSAAHGYYADTTRVFSVGEPTPRQREIHALLEGALAAGEAKLLPGIPARMVDAAVRNVIEQAGLGPYFTHDSGHGYGIFQREAPFLVAASADELETGMVIAVEPGIYIPGWGGMRLESTYLIENEGPRRLDCFPRDLIACLG